MIVNIYIDPNNATKQKSTYIIGGTITGNTINVQNLDAGLYMLRVSNPDYSASTYRHLLIGREGETTDVIIAHYAYIEETRIGVNLSGTPSTNDYANTSFGPTTSALSVATTGTNSYGGTGTAYNFASLLSLNMDVDAQLEFSAADLHMLSWYYYQAWTSSNEAQYSAVTSTWDQDIVTWNSRPTVDITQQVILAPSSNPNGFSTEMDVIDIRTMMTYWQTNPNYGLEIALTNYDPPVGAHRTQRKFGGGSYFTLSFTVKDKLTASYDEATQTGSILVDAPTGTLPYTYLMSYEPIPDLNTLWQQLKDSTGLDSAFFFQGKENTNTYTFNGLPSDKYYVAIFDNTGQEIYQGSTVVSSPITEEFISPDIIKDENNYTLDVNAVIDGQVILDGYIPKYEDGKIVCTVNEVASAILGFYKLDTIYVDTVEQYKFGLKMDDLGGVDVYSDGQFLAKTSYIIGDEFTLSKEGSNFKFYKNNTLIHDEYIVNNSYDDLRTELKIHVAGVPMAFAVLQYIKLPPLPIRHDYFSEVDCGTDGGRFHWNLTANHNVDPSTITISGTELTGGNPFSGIGASGAIPVDEGVYSVVINWQNTSGTWLSETFQFVVGNQIHWNIINDLTSTTTSLKAINWAAGTVGNAISTNTLEDGIDGWASFNVKTYQKSQTQSLLAYGDFALKNENNQEIVSVKLHGMGYGVTSKIVSITEEGTTIASFIMNGEGPIKITKTSGVINVFDNNGNLVSNFNTSITGDIKVSAQLKASIMYDSYTSFCEGLTSDSQCGHLDYELNGNYYYTNSGKFCFVYNEEYNDENIEYNIYNINNNIVATENDFVTQPLIHGENRVVLDFSQYDCMPKGYYVLEVINDKGEQFYLRFYNDSPISSANAYDEVPCIPATNY